jgi:hypothetical protein
MISKDNTEKYNALFTAVKWINKNIIAVKKEDKTIIAKFKLKLATKTPMRKKVIA